MTPAQLPPSLFLRFFRWYCHPRMIDYIEGDLMEVYRVRTRKLGKRKADIRFIIDVLLLFRPGIVKPLGGSKNLNTYGMYKSYLKIGWRNLLRNKGYSLINIGGLAIGMTMAILNGLWVWDEFSFNKYFSNYDRIAYVAETGVDPEHGGTFVGTTMTYPLGTAIINDHGQQFERVTRVSWNIDYIFSTNEIKKSVQGLCMDKSAPDMLSLKMIHGSRAGLSETHSVLISASTAKALFGDEDPVNHIVQANNKTNLTITGVFEDFPQNTKFNFVHFIAPWDLFLLENKWIEERALNDWRNHFMNVIVELPEGKSFETASDEIKSALKFDPQDEPGAIKREQRLTLYPMSEWHLHPTRLGQGQFEPLLMIKLVGAIGVFVLLLACINFVNLSTARAEKRSKEVGIRKTIGSIRSQLISQFFSESFLVVFFSFIFAVVLTAFFLPAFNNVASKEIAMPWTNIWFWAASLGFILITSVLAGCYPALYLSSFNPIRALKGTFRVGRLASLPRQVLVVFQFSISVLLIIGTAVVYQQIQYAKDRPVGYDREGLIMINKKSEDFNGKYDVLRNELIKTGAVLEISESMGPVTEVVSGNGGWEWKDRDPNLNNQFGTLAVSHAHGKTAGWKFIAGRDFDRTIASDSSGIVINESAMKMMKLKDPVGEELVWTWWVDNNKMSYKILGVVKDMVMESPYVPVTPTVFYIKGFNGGTNWINIRINPRVSITEALPEIENVFKKIIPAAPFEYKFVDEEYALKFAKEERIGNLTFIFAVLAVFISCLGLLGLASFVAETRTKEIGIRKVLGASVAGLWKMLSKNFIWLVLIACVVSAPLAYYVMSSWLQRFAYHTEISVWVFLGTASGAITITLVTISYQAIKTAMMNPVKSLKNE